MSGEIGNTTAIDHDEDNSNIIEINKKTCISKIINGALLIHKRGGLNLFQSRDLANAIDSFSDKNNKNQLDNINILIIVLEIGQSKGLFDINESRVLADVLDVLSDEKKLLQMVV